MKTTYVKFFSDEGKAHEWMRMKNNTARDGSIFCLTAGPDAGMPYPYAIQAWAVMDLDSAIDLNLYEWSL